MLKPAENNEQYDGLEPVLKKCFLTTTLLDPDHKEPTAQIPVSQSAATLLSAFLQPANPLRTLVILTKHGVFPEVTAPQPCHHKKPQLSVM